MENSNEGELMKVDKRGYVRVPRERREALLDEFERCGVSAAQFAAHIGVKYNTFAHWRQMREQKRATGGDSVALAPAALMSPRARPGMRWMEAVVEGSGGVESESKPALRIALPGGAHLEIASAGEVKLAAELLRALETRGRVAC
jgi:hypothetical protein